ncbi:unnamed protein product [Calypogeia fissa]
MEAPPTTKMKKRKAKLVVDKESRNESLETKMVDEGDCKKTEKFVEKGEQAADREKPLQKEMMEEEELETTEDNESKAEPEDKLHKTEAKKSRSPEETKETSDKKSEPTEKVELYKPDCEQVIKKLVKSLQVGAGGHLERTPEGVPNEGGSKGMKESIKAKSEPSQQKVTNIREEFQVYARLNQVSRLAMNLIARDQVQLMDLLESIGVTKFIGGDDVSKGWKLLKEKVKMMHGKLQRAQEDDIVTALEPSGVTTINRADKAIKEVKVPARDEAKNSRTPRADEVKGLLELKKSLIITSSSEAKENAKAEVEPDEKTQMDEKDGATGMDVE